MWRVNSAHVFNIYRILHIIRSGQVMPAYHKDASFEMKGVIPVSLAPILWLTAERVSTGFIQVKN